MSLDIQILGESYEENCCCSCGHEHSVSKKVRYWDGNITHNLTEMADDAGIYQAVWRPEELGIAKGKEMVDILERGIEELLGKRAEYEKFNPENGWGDFDSLVRFLKEYLAACKEFPEGEISVCR